MFPTENFYHTFSGYDIIDIVRICQFNEQVYTNVLFDIPGNIIDMSLANNRLFCSGFLR